MAIQIITGFRSSSREALDKRSGPYASVTDALAALDQGIDRYVGLQVTIVENSVLDGAGNFVGGDVKKYIFDEDIEDANLIPDGAGVWGKITGTITDQPDLQDQFLLHYLKSEHVSSPTGSDAGKPVELDQSGKIHTGFIPLDAGWHNQGEWTPVAGTEYPDPVNLPAGSFWSISGVHAVNGYTFVDPPLDGQTAFNGDLLIWAGNTWSLRTTDLNPFEYYKLDGSQPLTADLQAGGHVVSNLATGYAFGHSVEWSQWTTHNNLVDNNIAAKVSKAGDTMTGNLIVGDTEPYGSIGVVNNDATNGKSSFILRDHNGNPRGSIYSTNDGYVAIQKQKADQTVGAEFALMDDGNLRSQLNFTPASTLDLTPKYWVDDRVNSREPYLGDPTADGMILSSDTAGGRSWVPMSNDAVWGLITGQLVDQLDLQAALNDKAELVHEHTISEVIDLLPQLNDRYTVDHYIYEIQDPADPLADSFKPITLNANAKIDPSFLDTSTFHYIGSWDPSDPDGPEDPDNPGNPDPERPCDPVFGCEYPDTSDCGDGTPCELGAFWVVQGLVTEPYVFTQSGGGLHGKSVNNGDFMVYGAAGWSIMSGEMNPVLYYKLDGSHPLLASFQAGHNKLVNILPGDAIGDAVEWSQWDNYNDSININLNNKVEKSGDTMTGKLTVNHTIQSYNIKVGDGVDGNSLSIRGNTTDQNAYLRFRRPDDTDAGWLYLNDAEDHINLKVLDDNEIELSTFGFLRDGNISVSGAVPTEIDHLTRKDYVDTKAPLVHIHDSSELVLENSITANVDVGGVSSGTVFTPGMHLEEILNRILVKYILPEISVENSISLSNDPAFPTLLEIGTIMSYQLSTSVNLGTIQNGNNTTTPLHDSNDAPVYSGPGVNASTGAISATTVSGTMTYSVNVHFNAGTANYYDSNGDAVIVPEVEDNRVAEDLSSSLSTKGIYPLYYGMSATDFHTDPTNVDADLSKSLIDFDATPTANYSINGSSAYIYFVVGADEMISKILDGNGFDVTSSFSYHDVEVTTPLWSITRRIYRSTALTSVDPAQTYEITVAANVPPLN